MNVFLIVFFNFSILVAQLIALRRIVSCVEPGTAIGNLCSGAGNCEYDKDADEFSCSCQPGHEGLYCEIFKVCCILLVSHLFNPFKIITAH